MENLNNMNELEEMRRELQVLKDKVERKGVLNERLVKKSIRDNMKGIRHTIYIINRMDVENLGKDLKETANSLMEMKKRRSLQEKIAFCVLPIWMLWLGYEFYHNIANHSEAIAIMIGAVVGGVIGGAIGLSIYFKWQRKNDEMIEQINDLMEEE